MHFVKIDYRLLLAIYRRFSQYIDRFLEYIGDSTRFKDDSTMLDIPSALKEADLSGQLLLMRLC